MQLLTKLKSRIEEYGNGHPPPKGTKKAVGKDGVGNEKVNGNSGDGNDEGKDDSCLVVTIFNYLEM